ncbi:TPA: flagellar basal body L-ring protein FlgH [Candidatus Poribacteria bacterium]|jgi:flagellar L-ring protein precursor FlgH|nr:flagellar basal body L-ring protein FlgH [Candidatus Poribacteria bacterium]HIA70737.1 flagellar basal body L-ring protein FlgH [Candidatus Poribacteria bacterium]HIB86517.1 flagellar basal body L-ring protein FlgH [Candidatus Poribacteria bacterium]HIB98741.1 flagellar basal body L-ring protein FlgH [Candidatus Poribacteria bacterium]HIC19290.1 flagellar basal body L-ring protein FlgH [Candidatus Poribacteria bacterium]
MLKKFARFVIIMICGLVCLFLARGLDAQVLYREGQLTDELYSDLISRKVGDLLTVVIVQNAQANQNAQSSKNRSSALSANANLPGGTGFLGAIPDGSGTASLTGQTKRGGAQTTSRQTSFVATVTATIVQVFENGNMRVAGTQHTAIDDQETEISVEGIVRPLDISPNNSVVSSALANARIEYRAPDQQDKGGKIVEIIAFPFRFVGSLLGLLF